MLVQAGVEFMRDGYVAYRFAEHRAAQSVWLTVETRPDFGVMIGDRDHLFEVTEADWPDRRRSKEYKEDIIPRLRAGTATAEDGTDLFRMKPEEARALLQCAAEGKRDGQYDPACGLVILLQPGSWSSVVRGVEAIMAIGTEPARVAFREVWVDWKGRFYPTWRNGERMSPS